MSADNNTIRIESSEERALYSGMLIKKLPQKPLAKSPEGIIWGNFLRWAKYLPDASYDLWLFDPEYVQRSAGSNYAGPHYRRTFLTCLKHLQRLLRPTGTLYICSNWETSALVSDLIRKHFTI